MHIRANRLTLGEDVAPSDFIAAADRFRCVVDSCSALAREELIRHLGPPRSDRAAAAGPNVAQTEGGTVVAP
jgi:hypothetical protein